MQDAEGKGKEIRYALRNLVSLKRLTKYYGLNYIS